MRRKYGSEAASQQRAYLPSTADSGIKVGMQEQAAATLADLALDDVDLQDAIIEADGVGPLLAFIRTGSQLGQEHAARAIRNLCLRPATGTVAQMIKNQTAIVDCNTIPELVQLLKSGSPRAQEVSAAGLSDLANLAGLTGPMTPHPLRSHQPRNLRRV